MAQPKEEWRVKLEELWLDHGQREEFHQREAGRNLNNGGEGGHRYMQSHHKHERLKIEKELRAKT